MFFLTGGFLLLLIGNGAAVNTTVMSTSLAFRSTPMPAEARSTPLKTTSETSRIKPNSTDYDLALAIGFGLGGGLLLLVIVWLALLTIWACRKFRKTQHTLIDLQKHADGNQQTVVGNSYHNNMFVNNPPETIERQGDGIPYEIVGRPQTNELFYQRTNGTLYAYAGQAKK